MLGNIFLELPSGCSAAKWRRGVLTMGKKSIDYGEEEDKEIFISTSCYTWWSNRPHQLTGANNDRAKSSASLDVYVASLFLPYPRPAK